MMVTLLGRVGNGMAVMMAVVVVGLGMGYRTSCRPKSEKVDKKTQNPGTKTRKIEKTGYR